jgi:PST family polysaccharide transporter
MVPIWYFQGLEQVRVIAAITISTNMVAALGILFLVRSPDQSWLPLALRTAASSASLVAGLMLAYRVTPFLAPRLATSASALRQGFPLFIFRSATSMYTTANVLLLGLMAPPSVVALFAGAEKISRAAIAAVWPITQAFYPRISYLLSNDPRNASKTARLSVLLTLSAGAAASIAIFLGAPLLVRLLLGHGFEGSTPILRLFALLPVLMASSNVFGIQWMLPLRMDRTFNCILVAAGVVNLGLACILVPLAQQTGMAVSVVTAEAVVTASIIVVLMRRKMAPWDELPMEGESIIRPTTPSLPMSV